MPGPDHNGRADPSQQAGRFPAKEPRRLGNLGIDPGRFTAAIQFGSQRNFDYENLPEIIAKANYLPEAFNFSRSTIRLLPNPKCKIPGVMHRTLYPASDYLGAVDLMVTNAGYNSFHECVFGGIPSIFVPNQAPEMDDQNLRATYAYASGLGLQASRLRTLAR